MYGGVYAVHSASDQVRNLDKQYPVTQRMRKFFIPKKGDKVRVRLYHGNIVDAIYRYSPFQKVHMVDYHGVALYCCPIPSDRGHARFIGPSADMVPV
jgi:hypothetical protein